MNYSDFELKLQQCKNKNILLGFSGGADGCALFLLLAYWSKKVPFELTAVHFEHGLRGQSSLDDAAFCCKTAAEYKVPFLQFHLEVPQNMLKNESMEEAARRLRLEKWRQITEQFENCEVHLAHHSDDLAENVLLRLFRGANVSGLSGLREYSIISGMPVRRILLDFCRKDIEDFLRRENFTDYRTDITNFDCDIGRNFLRNKVLRDIKEHFPYAVKGIVQSAAVCEKDAGFIESAAEAEFNKISSEESLSNDFWLKLHPALRVRVLRLYLSRHLGIDYIPDKNFICRFEDSLQSANGKFEHKIELNSENFYVRTSDKWQIVQRNIEVLPAVKWNCPEQASAVFGDYIYNCEIAEDVVYEKDKYYFDFDCLQFPLELSPRREGDRFEKFGGGGTSVKAELTNYKIHGAAREKVGILRNGNGEIMLVGGFRRSSFAPVSGKKQKILQITVEKLKK